MREESCEVKAREEDELISFPFSLVGREMP
jgi:hypothetical protein